MERSQRPKPSAGSTVEKVLTWFDMRILHDAGIDQGGFGAAEGASQQLTVLREAAGFGRRILQDTGRDQGGWSVADGSRPQLAVLLRKYGNDDST